VKQLLPVDRQHLLATLSFALTHDSRLGKAQAADLMASIVAERIVSHLEAADCRNAAAWAGHAP
jgi:hypothetical protein